MESDIQQQQNQKKAIASILSRLKLNKKKSEVKANKPFQMQSDKELIPYYQDFIKAQVDKIKCPKPRNPIYYEFQKKEETQEVVQVSEATLFNLNYKNMLYQMNQELEEENQQDEQNIQELKKKCQEIEDQKALKKQIKKFKRLNDVEWMKKNEEEIYEKISK